jgi:glyoxylase-like metal-dependent hydrolase (beta-lactamase superfamily II)
VQEIVPGLHRWTAIHPRIRVEVSSYLHVPSRTAIDPLLPAEGIEWFEQLPPRRVVLSNRHHLRHAELLAQRFGCPILCHEAGLHEFEGGPEVEGFAFGEELAAGVVALEMDAICAEDTVLRLDAGGGVLLFADALINHGSLGFVPDTLIGENPEGVKRRIRERAQQLLEERFEHLVFAHGDPVLGGGREALRKLARSEG